MTSSITQASTQSSDVQLQLCELIIAFAFRSANLPLKLADLRLQLVDLRLQLGDLPLQLVDLRLRLGDLPSGGIPVLLFHTTCGKSLLGNVQSSARGSAACEVAPPSPAKGSGVTGAVALFETRQSLAQSGHDQLRQTAGRPATELRPCNACNCNWAS